MTLFTPINLYPPNYELLWRPEMAKEKITEGNARHAFEFLQLINDAETEEQKITFLKKWGASVSLSMLLSLNFNEKTKLDLPGGMPPYKRDEEVNADMKTPLASQIGRLKACLVGSGIKRLDRERVFIQVLEMVPAQEGDILCAAKDRTLTELFPNVTAELVAKVYPRYVQK